MKPLPRLPKLYVLYRKLILISDNSSCHFNASGERQRGRTELDSSHQTSVTNTVPSPGDLHSNILQQGPDT